MISLAASARALRQGPHLGGHDREAAPRIAGPGRLDAGVQGQQIRLEGDLVDHPDDLADLARGPLDAAHRIDGLADDLARMFGIEFRRADHLACMRGTLGGPCGPSR